MLKLSVILLALILSGCSTSPSVEPITAKRINPKLLETPYSPALLIPCRVAYPLRELSSQTTLEGLYKTFVYNLGQVEKCYNKDGELVDEVIRRSAVDG